MLVWLFWQRFLYRQLMYAVLIKSVTTALSGMRTGWGKLERKGTVEVVDILPAPEPDTPLGRYFASTASRSFSAWKCADERLDDDVEVAVHDVGEVVDGQADAVVGDAVLREVVGADLLASGRRCRSCLCASRRARPRASGARCRRGAP